MSLLGQSAEAATAADWRLGDSISRQMLALPDLTRVQTAAGLSHLCVHLINLAEFDSAHLACRRSIAADLTAWGGYLNRGHLYYARGDLGQARIDYKRAQTLNPAAPVFDMAYMPQATYIVPTPKDSVSQLSDASK